MAAINRQAVSVVAIVVTIATGWSGHLTAQSEKPATPINSIQADTLVKSALIALNNANRTGNYTVLSDLGSPAFRAANSLSRLAAAFAALRVRNVDLVPMSALSPDYMRPPYIDQKGLLNLVGFFAANRLRIDFDIVYQNLDGRWLLAGLSVGASDSGYVASLPDASKAIGDAEPSSDPRPMTSPQLLEKKAGLPSSETSRPSAGQPPNNEKARLKTLEAEKHAGHSRTGDESQKTVLKSEEEPAKPSPTSPTQFNRATNSIMPPLPVRRPASPKQKAGLTELSPEDSLVSTAEPQELQPPTPQPHADKPKQGYFRRILRNLNPINRNRSKSTPDPIEVE